MITPDYRWRFSNILKGEMKSLYLKFLIVAACFSFSKSDDCYWVGWPWCGLVLTCGKDHFMWYGITAPCLLSPDKYCCPAKGSSDFALCQHKDFKGGCISHSLDSTTCVTVDKNDWASSIDSFDNCVRIYEHDHCQGRSVAIYPGSNGHNNLEVLGMNDMVTSVGRCFQNDPGYQCSRSKRSGNKCEFAMDVLTIGFLSWLRRDTAVTGPVVYYQTGPNGRTESMEALILPRHLGTGTNTNQLSRNYASQTMGNNNDDAGHILASNLGGSGTDFRNIFPQSRNINRGVWAQAEGMVAEVVHRYGSARYNVNLEYDSQSSTRPFKIVYRVARGDTNEVIVINDIVNP